jgi:hypothetical protein
MKMYRNRLTWLIGVREVVGWQLKVYGISASGEWIANNVVEAALSHVADNVPWPDREDVRYGFVTIHAGEDSVWLLVDIWMDEILRHFLYAATDSSQPQFKPGPRDGTTACVWELQVIRHERDAWVEHVLSKPATPDFEGYLLDHVAIEPE